MNENKKNIVTVANDNTKKVATTNTSNNKTVKYIDTGLNQSKGFIDGYRNTCFTVRNKYLIKKGLMVKGQKFGDVKLSSKNQVQGVLRAIKNDCELKLAQKISRLGDFDYTSILQVQNDKFKNDNKGVLYTNDLKPQKITETVKKTVNDLVLKQTLYSLQTNLNSKVTE